MFKRLISSTINSAINGFKVVSLTGPRQSGKTTLLRMLFADAPYYNLESPSKLAAFQEDPELFLHKHDQLTLIDEAQRFPELFSYLQVQVDERNSPGQFILSGSQNFLLSDKINQSLAGRVAQLTLLPLTYQEYLTAYPEPDLLEYLYNGGYPGLYHEGVDKKLWFENYIATYLERDVRQLLNVSNLAKFHKFLVLCAGRHGQLLNAHDLAGVCGVSGPTIESWLSILEASYVIYRLQPYHQNFNKRIIKTPKLYFYDSGLVCHLLNIDSPSHLEQHAARGHVFEGFIISELCKLFHAKGRKPSLYFWRSQQGDEIDCIIELGQKLIAIEIKSSVTYSNSLLKALHRWERIVSRPSENVLVYGGEQGLGKAKGIKVISWREISSLLVDLK